MTAGRHYVPGNLGNPFRLALRLFKESNPAARHALAMAVAGIALAPLDIAFRTAERRIYDRAAPPGMPIIIVCGPPRSGTTLVAQYLINTLEAGYLTNLTSLFPRSPLFASKVLPRWARPRQGGYSAFYGKSAGLAGANDALYIWDRWLGANRSAVPRSLEPGSEREIVRFFGALQESLGLPLVLKVNRLNTCAHLVADVLPGATMLCLRRDPLMLAQSLYIARRDINGDMTRPYGTEHPDRIIDDPVADVCRQVEFFERCASEQASRLSADRFRILDYESFCRDPRSLASDIVRSSDRLAFRASENGERAVFSASRSARLPHDILSRMAELLNEPLPTGV